MTTDEANSIIYHYYYDVLKFCGCYTPDAILEEVKEALDLFDQDRKTMSDEAWKARLAWVDDHLILTYLLDALGLTEHGYNISGQWLTPKGEKLLEALHAADERWDDAGGRWTADQMQEMLAEQEAFVKEWA